MAKRIIYRKGLGGYLLDEIMGINDTERKRKRKELEIMEKNQDPNSISCSECGKVGIIARCSANKSILTSEKCDRPLCKNCVVKKGNKYFCGEHQ